MTEADLGNLETNQELSPDLEGIYQQLEGVGFTRPQLDIISRQKDGLAQIIRDKNDPVKGENVEFGSDEVTD